MISEMNSDDLETADGFLVSEGFEDSSFGLDVAWAGAVVRMAGAIRETPGGADCVTNLASPVNVFGMVLKITLTTVSTWRCLSCLSFSFSLCCCSFSSSSSSSWRKRWRCTSLCRRPWWWAMLGGTGNRFGAGNVLLWSFSSYLEILCDYGIRARLFYKAASLICTV